MIPSVLNLEMQRPLTILKMAEGVGFEPTVQLPVRLISSQVPSTAQPPFRHEHDYRT